MFKPWAPVDILYGMVCSHNRIQYPTREQYRNQSRNRISFLPKKFFAHNLQTGFFWTSKLFQKWNWSVRRTRSSLGRKVVSKVIWCEYDESLSKSVGVSILMFLCLLNCYQSFARSTIMSKHLIRPDDKCKQMVSVDDWINRWRFEWACTACQSEFSINFLSLCFSRHVSSQCPYICDIPCWPPRGQQMSHQRWIWGLCCMQAIKHGSRGIHPGYETQRKCHQKFKTGVPVAP